VSATHSASPDSPVTPGEPGRALVFDPFAGIAGDMTLAALVDLGLPAEWLSDFVAGLGLGELGVEVERVDRSGIAATRVQLRLPHEHAHRHISDVLEIIDRARVDDGVRSPAAAAFRALAEAEAEVHGTTPERIHFHEVGALDAIVDVLGSVAGCHQLGFDTFYTRPVTVGRGTARMAHGTYPVPAPAVLKLLRGFEVRDPGFEGECTTPTGAALLRALTGGASPPVAWSPVREGFGAGTRDPKGRPNVLRMLEVQLGGAGDAVIVLQADVDDMSAEYAPALVEALISAGAVDASLTPLQMKKGRPGLRVEALVPPGRLAEVRRALFEGSSTIGVRWWWADRAVLQRSEIRLSWEGEEIRAKVTTLPGGGQRIKPEYEDVVSVAERLGMAPYRLQERVLRALGDAGDGAIEDASGSSDG
jgi:pyridinium-3,5-bisthiocarboxylic acid mononucleotide nickel chelatase